MESLGEKQAKKCLTEFSAVPAYNPMDNDEAGRDLAEQIEALARDMAAKDLSILRHLPEDEGMDWNDCLKASGQSRPPEPAGP